MLCLVAAPCVILVFGAGLKLVEQWEYNSQLADMRSKGLPTNASEVNEYYKVPTDATDSTAQWLVAISEVRAAEISRRGQALQIVGSDQTEIPNPGEPWEKLEASRNFLNEVPVAMVAIRTAAETGGKVRFPTDFALGVNAPLTEIQDSRTIARLLLLDAHVAAHDRNIEQAVDDVRAIFSLSNSQSTAACNIAWLVRVALHATACQATSSLLTRESLSEQDLLSLQNVAGSADFRGELRFALGGECGLTLSAVDNFSFFGFRLSNKQLILQDFGDLRAALSEPWPEVLILHDEISKRHQLKNSSTLTKLTSLPFLQLMTGVQQMGNAGVRAEARQNCTVVALAAMRYRLQHGQFPDSMADLRTFVPGTESEITRRMTDPFDGQPLRFRNEPAGLLIYSIYHDKKDDGGDLVPSSNRADSKDLGVRLVK